MGKIEKIGRGKLFGIHKNIYYSKYKSIFIFADAITKRGTFLRFRLHVIRELYPQPHHHFLATNFAIFSLKYDDKVVLWNNNTRGIYKNFLFSFFPFFFFIFFLVIWTDRRRFLWTREDISRRKLFELMDENDQIHGNSITTGNNLPNEKKK